MSKERLLVYRFKLIVISLVLILFYSNAHPWPYPTVYQNCTLDNAVNTIGGLQDYTALYCDYNIYTDHYIRQYSEIRNFSPISPAIQCIRDTRNDYYTYYTSGCGISSTNETYSDTGWGCASQPYFTSLEFFVGDISKPLVYGGPCVACGLAPGGTDTDSSQMSISLVLACPKPYKGSSLQIQAETTVLETLIPVTGYELLMNGIAPYYVNFEKMSTYVGRGSHSYEIPILGNCGEIITLTPTVAGGYSQAEILYLTATYRGLGIMSPIDNSDYDLADGTHTGTLPIDYRAHVEPVGGASVIDWNESLNYRTSGGRCSGCDSVRIFQTVPDSDYYYNVASLGGQATVKASAVINGQLDNAAPIRFTVTGIPIPDGEITDRLVNLYGGTTRNLMTGLAMKESTYMQFAQRSLYGKNDRWPNESYDGGSHIGLMMVETTMDRAWNWLQNTSFGVNLYKGTSTNNGEKMGLAVWWEGKIKAKARKDNGCGLRDLTGVERENMALVLYGPYANGIITGQYYYYQATTIGKKTTCDWVINTQGNINGVGYADEVRSLCR